MANIVNLKKHAIMNTKYKNNLVKTDEINKSIDEVFGEEIKVAIVILTRGYDTMRSYYDLLNRNINIERNLSDKNIELVFFHEGNITDSQQRHIRNETKALRQMKFVSIKGDCFLEEKKHVEISAETKKFDLNYRHMCHFWFVDFWRYCSEYDLILRIDEDCFIDFDPVMVFGKLVDKVSVYGFWDKDLEYVTQGMNDFTMRFLKESNKSTELIECDKKSPSGPYTNIIGLNLKKLRENELLQEYIAKVDESDCIYKYRWGDLPLWGEVLHYFYKKEDHMLNNKIKYFHKSHNFRVN